MSAKYTELLRNLMIYESTREDVLKALSTYPLYQSENPSLADLIPTREKLNEKLINHYKYREIGFETVPRFLDELEITMCEIMPRYNELLKTVEIMAELPSPFDNVDVVETFEQEATQSSQSEGSSSQSGTSSQSSSNSQTVNASGENNGTSSASIDNTSNSKRLTSDTPQNEISVGTKNISDVGYASEGEWIENTSEGSETRTTKDTNTSQSQAIGSNSSDLQSSTEGSSSGSSETSGTIKHTLTKKGNQGVNTYAHDMNEFRTSIIDVVNQIINDKRLDELFMQVY